jgi:hypothetical protein
VDKQMKNKLTIWFLYGTMTLLTLLLVLCLYWAFYPYQSIKFNGDYKTEKTSYTQGDETFYVVDYCKYTDVTPSIQKEFVDGLVFTAESPQAFLTKGCRKEEVPMTIPHTLPSGKYRLKVSTQYRMSPFQTDYHVHYSNWFVVQEEHKDLEQDIEAMNKLKEEVK